MKKTGFLIKLRKEEKLELIGPSDEMKQAYLAKSESNLISAKILLANSRFEESVGLAYYSMYHLLIALLFKAGIKSKNHSASIILLKELFKQDNKDIFDAKTERVDKQYYVDFVLTRKDVEDTIRKAEVFNSKMIDFVSKVNNEDIRLYRDRFIELTDNQLRKNFKKR